MTASRPGIGHNMPPEEDIEADVLSRLTDMTVPVDAAEARISQHCLHMSDDQFAVFMGVTSRHVAMWRAADRRFDAGCEWSRTCRAADLEDIDMRLATGHASEADMRHFSQPKNARALKRALRRVLPEEYGVRRAEKRQKRQAPT